MEVQQDRQLKYSAFANYYFLISQCSHQVCQTI